MSASENAKKLIKKMRASQSATGGEAPDEIQPSNVDQLKPRVEALSPAALEGLALNYLDTLDADEQEQVLAELEQAEEPVAEPAAGTEPAAVTEEV